MENNKEKVEPGFQTEWSTPQQRDEIKKALQYSRIDISPLIYLHPMVISYSKDAEKFQTSIAYKWLIPQRMANKIVGASVVALRHRLEVICADHNVLIQRFNPFALKSSANKYHVVLVYKIDEFLGADKIRQMQIKFSNIRKQFNTYLPK